MSIFEPGRDAPNPPGWILSPWVEVTVWQDVNRRAELQRISNIVNSTAFYVLQIR
jgi:hypothetical protein